MAKTKANLITDFSVGQLATPEKFVELINSSYNVTEDSVLSGPIGQTGLSGFWYDGTTGNTGQTGQVMIGATTIKFFTGVTAFVEVAIVI